MKMREAKRDPAKKMETSPDLNGMNAEELFNYIRNEIKQACQRKSIHADSIKETGINTRY